MRLWWIEWQKNRKNRIVWIMLALMFIALPGMVFIGNELKDMPAPFPGKEMVVSFPHVWDFLAYNGSWQSFFFLGFLAIYLITSEFNYGTVKQNVIQGHSRKSFFTGKLLFIGSIIGVTFLYYLVLGLTSGFIQTESLSDAQIWGEEGIIGRYLLMTIGYCSFAILVAFLFRKTGPALLFYFAYILFLEPVWRWLMHRRLFDGNSQFFYPMNAMEDLCPLPLYKMVPDFMNIEQTGIYILSPSEAIWTVSIYTCAFLALAYVIFMRRDV